MSVLISFFLSLILVRKEGSILSAKITYIASSPHMSYAYSQSQTRSSSHTPNNTNSTNFNYNSNHQHAQCSAPLRVAALGVIIPLTTP